MQVGFIGLGNMASGMAANLLKAGRPMTHACFSVSTSVVR